jgi:UDP-N-acetyl-D-mannosaminuronate dehydrogenase
MWSAKVAADDAKVLLLGWSYKAEVGDPRETPAEPLAETLMSKGITVGAWDPHLEHGSFPEGVVSIADLTEAQDYDMVVLVTAHKACLELDWQRAPQSNANAASLRRSSRSRPHLTQPHGLEGLRSW